MDRREFIATGGVAVLSLHASITAPKTTEKRFKAILFDSFPIFNPAEVYKLALQFFPQEGSELIKQWKTKQFEYTWLRTVSGNYQDFLTTTGDALTYAAAATSVTLSNDQKDQLISAWYHLEIWPDVLAALQQLKGAGYRLGILSNFTPKMLTVNVDNNQLNDFFEHLISVDPVKKYKPAPEAYELGMKTFGLSKDEILFVPFAGWDAAGSKQFGYKTFWVNRLQTPPEQLGVFPNAWGKDLSNLVLQLSYLK